MADNDNGMRPDEIAQAVTEGIQGGEIGTLRAIAPFLMKECGLEERDALAIAEAVAQKWQLCFFPPITRMELFLTENCNLRCDYCFVEGKNEFRTMTLEVAKRAVDFMCEKSGDTDALSLFFMGGEPFLAWDVLKPTVEYAEARAEALGKRIGFSVTTNGTLFTEEMLAFCQEHELRFLLSLDGAPETHDRHRKRMGGQGSAARIMELLPLMRKYQPWMGARMTIHPDAVDKVFDNVRFLVDNGMRYFIIGPATGIDWTEADLDTYEVGMKRVADLYKALTDKDYRIVIDLFRNLDNLYDKKSVWGCQAGRHSITVATGGDIYACSKMLGLNELGGIYRLGDLERGITEVDARAELVGMWKKRDTQCMSCDVADACTGGCFATNYGATGSVFDPCEASCRVVRRNLRIRQYAAEILNEPPVEPEEGDEACVV